MADCVIPNCRKRAISRFSAFCIDHCDKTPCGECHLRPGERCDICGARESQTAQAPKQDRSPEDV